MGLLYTAGIWSCAHRGLKSGCKSLDKVCGSSPAGVVVAALCVSPHVLHPVHLKHLLHVVPQADVGDHYVLAHLHVSFQSDPAILQGGGHAQQCGNALQEHIWKHFASGC